MLSGVLLAAFGAASAVSALVPRGVCNADNCLRALRASSPQTRLAQASKDCAAFMVVTVTPPVSTVTDFSTISSTETLVDEATATNTAHTTVTTIVRETHTETIFTSTATITQTVGGENAPGKREAPTKPGYASACPDTVRYLSACSCIGVTAAQSTVTAPTSTTTITVPTTVLQTAQETATVATTDVTVIDTTVTETHTASETVSTVTTTTVTVSAPTSTALTVGLEVTGRAPGFLSTTTSGTIDVAGYTTDASKAASLSLKPDGTLWLAEKRAYGHESGNNLLLFFYSGSGSTLRKPLTCGIDATMTLTCQVPGVNNNKVGMPPTSTWLYTGTQTNLQSGYQFVTLRATLL